MAAWKRVLAGAYAFALIGATAGCALIAPDRTIRSTMTLAPGQSATGRIEMPDGSGFAGFQQEEPRQLESGSWTYMGSDRLRISFPGDRFLHEEYPLGYASQAIGGERVCRVVVRNADTAPRRFDWIVTGAADAIAEWEMTGPQGTFLFREPAETEGGPDRIVEGAVVNGRIQFHGVRHDGKRAPR